MTFVLGSIQLTLALGVGVFVGRRHERQVWVQIIEEREAVDTGKLRNLIEYRVPGTIPTPGLWIASPSTMERLGMGECSTRPEDATTPLSSGTASS